MLFVLDASVAACWAFADEEHPLASYALRILPDREARAPALRWFELRNTLIVGERRGRIQPGDTVTFLAWILQAPMVLDRSPDESALLFLARRHKLTVYDAAYLELAGRLNAPLATLDKKLAAAALAETSRSCRPHDLRPPLRPRRHAG